MDGRVPSRRCLLLSTAANFGGMERMLCGLSCGLTALGWQTQAVFPESPDREKFVAWCAEQDAQVEISPAVLDASAHHTVRDIVALRRLARQARPDIVNIHYGSNFISFKDVLAVRAAGVTRCIATVHMSVDWHVLGARKRLMTRLAATLCHTVVAVSGAARDVLVDAGVPTAKVRVIPPGVRVPAESRARAEARRRFDLPADAFVVASVAQLIPRKGIADLVDALALVPGGGEDLRLIVAGDGPERSALEARARERLGERATFVGFLDDVSDVYAAADLFVLPSYLEGLPLVYVEAAYHGLPSIGSDTGDVREIVRNGETGLVVPPGQPEALAVAIHSLQCDPALRLRLGAAARRRALAESTDALMVQRYDSLFSGALA